MEYSPPKKIAKKCANKKYFLFAHFLADFICRIFTILAKISDIIGCIYDINAVLHNFNHIFDHLFDLDDNLGVKKDFGGPNFDELKGHQVKKKSRNQNYLNCHDFAKYNK